MAWPVFAAMALNNYLEQQKRQRQAEEEKREAAAEILSSNARSLGASTAAPAAAQAQQRAEKLYTPDRISMLQEYLKDHIDDEDEEGIPYMRDVR